MTAAYRPALLLRGPAAAPAVQRKDTPAVGRRVQDPGSSKRGLASTLDEPLGPASSLGIILGIQHKLLTSTYASESTRGAVPAPASLRLVVGQRRTSIR